MYNNCHINLEMRIKLRSDSRLADLTKVSMVSIIITTLSFLLGMFAFPS